MRPTMNTPPSQRDRQPHAASPAGLGQALRGLVRQPLYWLLVALPVAVGLEWSHAGDLWIFLASAAAIIPLAGLMGRATESLAETLGAGIGGLLNATFGNAAELIIALIALSNGPAMYPLVKASLTGSIIGNVLMVLGLSILVGGLKYSRQQFNRTAASMGATLLALATIGLVVPTLYFYIFSRGHTPTPAESANIEYLSEEIAAILAFIYVLSLVFSLWTHQHLFAGSEEEVQRKHPPEWSRITSLAILFSATAAVAWMSELLVGSVQEAANTLGMNQVFVGVIVVATVGNAAEHSTAVLMALKNKMDLSVNIAVASGLQISLFVAPVLVFASMLMGLQPTLDLHFTILEMVTLVLAVLVLALVSQDGESHWMEGVMLLGVYVILALAFFHLPSGEF
jgi:Ca2+:H+ antiporter